jgi:hypothetical protein
MGIVFEKVERPLQTRATKENPYAEMVAILAADESETLAVSFPYNTEDDVKHVASQITLAQAAGRAADVTVRKVVAVVDGAKKGEKVAKVSFYAREKITRARRSE